jgi:phosphatidylcholine synthase
MFQKLLAWCVHFYTALGLVAAAFSVVLIVMGGDENLRTAIIFLFIAIAIDASDGYFARLVRVMDVLPLFDGRRLDDIIDFHTYTTIPLLFIWRTGLLPGDSAWILLLPLLAGAYGFSQTNAKTEDGYFLGFPSYWNVVAFYLYFLQPEVWFSAITVIVFSVLTFIPSKYLHPSVPGPFSTLSVILGAAWALVVLAVITGIVDEYIWTLISLTYPVYYMTVSWMITFSTRKRS